MFKENYNADKNITVVENLGAESFERMLKEDGNAVLLDVRTAIENQMARIPNSLLIDFTNPAFKVEVDKLDKRKNYFVYCRSGNRSYLAGVQMLQVGFKKVYNLKPGIIGWKGEIEKEISKKNQE